MTAVVAHGPSAWWYVTRGAGAVTLVLLTASVVLGIAELRRWQPLGAPRFAVASLHRTVSLLAVAMLVVHIATTVVDPFPSIAVANAVVPFATSYRPLWIGLGTIAADVLFAVALTSMVRGRLGFRTWRVVHWASYACWPIAVLHGLGSGSDARTGWMVVLTAACVLSVAAVALGRLAASAGAPALRVGAIAALVLGVLATAAWARQGPLATGWARRAGTPAAVLASFAPPRTTVAKAAQPRADALYHRFTASLTGPVHTGQAADGSSVVDIPLRLVGGHRGSLRVRLAGEPLPDGGVRVQRSAISLGPTGSPGRYQGRVRTLAGGDLRAVVGAADGHALRLHVRLHFEGSRASGTVTATPETG